MDLIGHGWFFYTSAQVVLIIAALCLVGALLTAIMRFRSTALSLVIIGLVMGAIGASVLFGLRANGHNRYERIADLHSAAWQVLWLDETTNTAGVLVDGREYKINMREVDSRWTAYLQCMVEPANDSETTVVNLSTCMFTPPTR